jgi:hypothetical protein
MIQDPLADGLESRVSTQTVENGLLRKIERRIAPVWEPSSGERRVEQGDCLIVIALSAANPRQPGERISCS